MRSKRGSARELIEELIIGKAEQGFSGSLLSEAFILDDHCQNEYLESNP